MQLIKVDLSLMLKLDRFHALKEMLPFDGEALTSKQDIKEKLVPDRRAKSSYCQRDVI
jgi:hypothetical protein